MSELTFGRRGLLAGALAVGVAGAARGKPDSAPGLIDVHHHIRPPEAPAGFAKLTAAWTPARALDQMDRAGVATAMAYPGPVRPGEAAENRRLARLWNTFGADLGRAHAGRFGLFASLPMQDVDGALGEIDFALDDLHADGFGMATSYGEAWLGDERFWPIYEKLNHRAAVVFVHPNDATCCQEANLSYMRGIIDTTWIEWPMNTARTILSLMVSGTLRKFPDVKFVFSHGGGVMPLLVQRIAGLKAWDHVGEDALAKVFPNGVEAEFRTLRFECAQAASATNMAALRSLVPDTHIFFGSDYPFFPVTYAAERFRALALPPEAARAIGRDNARALLPRWA